MDERRVADYFVVAGLVDDPEPLDEASLSEGGHLKTNYSQPPITDIGIIFPSLGEKLPPDFEVILRTPTGLSADLNHGSLRSTECLVCYRRGRDKPPLVDIGVMYEGKEWLMEDAEVVKESVGGHVANVNNSTALTFVTYRRGQPTMPCNALVVTDICVVIASKGESPPHAFCCIYKNLNKGIVGSDVFLCYKKSMNRATLITYKPSVLCRYPMVDLPHFPFPNSVPLFCLPMGASLELWPIEASQPKPVFSTFVLTVSDAKHKVYGSAVTFYERYPEEKLNNKQKEMLNYSSDGKVILHVNKSICVLSHWPFSDTFERWLLFLHGIVSSGQPQPVSVERYIVQLLDEVPFPGPRTLLQLSAHSPDRVIMTQPEDIPLPRSAAGFRQLLLNLGSENCLLVLLLALTEQKILIHSLRPDTLTAVAEAVSSFLFPFKWQCPYIPLCPLGLVEVLHAPLPFLIGVDSRFFDLYDPPPDVSCVDLDTNIITIAENQRQLLNVKLLPKRAAKCLKNTLDDLYAQLRKVSSPVIHSSSCIQMDLESEFQKRKKDQAQELEIQEAFLKFMASTLKGYRSFLLPITKAPTVGTTDPQALFQLNEFLKSRDKTHHKFFSLLMRTQMFIRFIEETSFVADGDQGLAFFDECIDRLTHEEGDVRLLEFDTIHNSDRTVFLLPPEPTGQDHCSVYTEFLLDTLLLSGKKKNHLTSFQHIAIPGSPMARRTKHEIKFAQKLARECIRSPGMWARCLSGTCHTLYFMTLPSMLSLNYGKEKLILQQAYDMLVRATQQGLKCDEVCYRLMMQLCGEHSKPLLAVKLLLLMKRSGIQPNALTYGLYNRCVLEAEWPAQASSSQLLWNKLRYVVLGAAHFRWAAKRHAARRLSSSVEGGSSLLDAAERTASHSSLDSHEMGQGEKLLDKVRSTFASIVRGGTVSSAEETDSVIEPQTEYVENDVLLEDSENHIDVSFTPPESPSECRLLSRSESGGDANILDKLQQNVKRNCTRSLHFNGDSEIGKNSPGKISPRTLVTENDPLGALEHQLIPKTCITPPTECLSPINSQNMPFTDDPILFRTAVQRSATFEGSPPTQNKLHRSETVPAASVTSSLANLGSTLKIGFSRYSPKRLSLRKSDLKVPEQLFENMLNNFSPSNLTGKKSNELIQGGISSLRSAATTVVKKLDEIKEAMASSANSTPVKVQTLSDRLGTGDNSNEAAGEGESTDGSDIGIGDRHRKTSGEFGSNRGSCVNLKETEDSLPDNCFLPLNEDTTCEDSEMDIVLTSCSQCHNCSSILYDEEIMSNWSAEDSNLNTTCQACNKSTVPLLTITITKRDQIADEPFSVPYLNPLVLRKELENILAQEGDLSLADAKFVEEHPIIYWNLVWTFERINVQTHLPNLCLRNKFNRLNISDEGKVVHQGHCDDNKINSEQEDAIASSFQLVEEGTDPLTQELVTIEHLEARVNVRCMWDHPRFHTDCLPLYFFWKRKDAPSVQTALTTDQNHTKRNLMQQVISSVHYNDLGEPLKMLALERQRTLQKANRDGNSAGIVTYSLYRDILFLACKAVGRANIDLNVFDKKYAAAFARATERNNKLYGPQDRPLNINAAFCRQYFRPLCLP